VFFEVKNGVRVQHQSVRGFTFLELIIALFIVSIVALFSVQSLNYFWQKAEGDVVRRAIIQALSFARASAIAHREKIILCKSVDRLNCNGISWQQGMIIKSENKVLSSIDFSNKSGEVRSRFFPRGRVVLKFLPNGFPEVQNGTFWYCVKNKTDAAWAIVINRSGRIRQVFPDKSGKIIDAHSKVLPC